jgi:hypothetical protein
MKTFVKKNFPILCWRNWKMTKFEIIFKLILTKTTFLNLRLWTLKFKKNVEICICHSELANTEPWIPWIWNRNVKFKQTEAVFLVSLKTSSFPAGNEVYGKSIESLFLAGNELAPSSFPAWLKIRPLVCLDEGVTLSG